jgi:hypothetical protein
MTVIKYITFLCINSSWEYDSKISKGYELCGNSQTKSHLWVTFCLTIKKVSKAKEFKT